jgi:hypothetical protein
MATNVTGKDMEIITEVLNEWRIGSGTKPVAVQKMDLMTGSVPVQKMDSAVL